MRESRTLGSVRAKAEWLSYSTIPLFNIPIDKSSSRDHGYTQPERALGGRAVPGRTLRSQDHTDL